MRVPHCTAPPRKGQRNPGRATHGQRHRDCTSAWEGLAWDELGNLKMLCAGSPTTPVAQALSQSRRPHELLAQHGSSVPMLLP